MASSSTAAPTAGYTLNTAHEIRLKAIEAERAHARLDQPLPRFVMMQPATTTALAADPAAAAAASERPDEAAAEPVVAMPFPAEPLPLFPSIHLQHQAQAQAPQTMQSPTSASRFLGAAPVPAAAASFVYGDVLARFPGRTPIAMQLGRSGSLRGGGGGGEAHAASATSFSSASAAFTAASAGSRGHHQQQQQPLINPITAPHSYTPSVAHLSRAPSSHAKPAPSFTAHRRATTHPHPRDRPSYRPELAAHPGRSGPAVSSAMLLRRGQGQGHGLTQGPQSGSSSSRSHAPAHGLSGGRHSSRGWLHSTRVDDSAGSHRKLRGFDEELLFGAVNDPAAHRPQQLQQPEEKQDGSAVVPTASTGAAPRSSRRLVNQSSSEAQLAATILAHAIAARNSRPLAERKPTVRRTASVAPGATATAPAAASVPVEASQGSSD